MIEELLPKAIKLTLEKGPSTSLLQRHLHLGYNTASKLMDRMSELGVVGPHNGAKPRELLIKKLPEKSAIFDKIKIFGPQSLNTLERIVLNMK